MRKVPRLLASPPKIATYVANEPADAIATGKAAGPAWDRFRDDDAYKELRDALVARQQGLCVYCEQRLTRSDGTLEEMDQQVEHVLAKSKAAGRVLDWSNLALCCGGGTWKHHTDPSRYAVASKKGANESCGQRKDDDELPHGLDPRAVATHERFVTVDLEGVMLADRAACPRVGLDPDEVNEVIEFLNLNCERLRLARQQVRKDTTEWYVPLLRELLDGTHLDPGQQAQMMELMVAGRLQPDAYGHLRAWWTTIREALGAPADRWISANLAVLHY